MVLNRRGQSTSVRSLNQLVTIDLPDLHATCIMKFSCRASTQGCRFRLPFQPIEKLRHNKELHSYFRSEWQLAESAESNINNPLPEVQELQ
jgi:hypothetical protein